jgi:microcystin-dependent protein
LSGALSVTEDLTVGTTTASKKATVHGNIETTGQFIGFGTVPLGGIIMWSGSVVPDGWAVCDGQKVTGSDGDIFTPDLSGRFIVGAVLDLTGPGDQSKPLNHTGGHDKVTLETENLPPHQHTGTTEESSSVWHYVGINHDGGGNVFTVATWGGPTNYGTSPGPSHTHAFTTDNNFNSTMKSTHFSIVPKYYALAYIMRIQ